MAGGVPLEEALEGKGGGAELSVDAGVFEAGRAGMGGAEEEGAADVLPLSGKGGKAGAFPLGAAVVVCVPPGMSGRGGISCASTQPAKVTKITEIKNRFNIPQLLALAGEKALHFKLNFIPRR